jgi:hypothetical protein
MTLLKDIEIKTDGQFIIIAIPIDGLNNFQQNRPVIPLTITDIDKMKKWVGENLLEFRRSDSELGEIELTEFELFINSMFVYAYEHAEAWLKGCIGESKKLKRNK